MVKFDYTYRAKSTFEPSSDTGLIVSGNFDCVTSDEEALKGKAAIEILKSLHHQGILSFAQVTIFNEIEEKRINLIQKDNENI